MKKRSIFLIVLMGLLLTIPVKAQSATFYEAEYIDGIYMNKYQYSTKTIYYQKARFFRKTDTGEFAYCIEPFRFFNDNASYESTVSPTNLTKEQIDRISKIAHFGYGYKNHTDTKWYAITQMMIWQTADTTGDYYFTDSLNGNRINPYQAEINEINSLITSYSITPSFLNKTYEIVENHTLVLQDSNNVLSLFQTKENNLRIEKNTLTISNLKEGSYEFTLYKEDTTYNKPLIFYQSSTSQNLVKTGDLNKLEGKIKVKVTKTYLELNKIDKDTKSIVPSGEAILDGAIYYLYDENNQKIQELKIQENQSILENINFGKYYLKEITPGIGYTLDETIYEINISKDSPKIELVLENEVIKKRIKIEKKYGDNNSLNWEQNIQFQIFNYKNELVDTVTTNEQGTAELSLPYGTYTITQVNSTEGYQKVDSFQIEVNDTEEEIIELKDLKIPVPNTHTDQKDRNWILLLISVLHMFL